MFDCVPDERKVLFYTIATLEDFHLPLLCGKVPLQIYDYT